MNVESTSLRADGGEQDLSVNGVNEHSFIGTASRSQACKVAGVLERTAPIDVLDGKILSFASYDSALSQAEITTHATAFASS